MLRHRVAEVVVGAFWLLGPVAAGAQGDADDARVQPAPAAPASPDTTERAPVPLAPPAADPAREVRPAGAPGASTAPDSARSEVECAADVADAPLPTHAGGTVVDRSVDDAGLWLPRALLFVPRWALELVFGIPRFGMWAYDRFQIKERWKSIFFNDTGTMGIYPVAFVETGFGLNAGARFVHRDLFGHEERFRLRASYGGRLRQHYSAKLSTGRLLGEGTQLDIVASWEIFPKSRFFGIGNRDVTTSPATPIDALQDRTAVSTRYRHDDATAELTFETAIADPLTLRFSGTYKHRDFSGDIDSDEDPEVGEVYATESLVGYQNDLDSFYPEIELTIDTRDTAEFFQSPASPSTGWKLTGFAGYRHGIRDDPSGHVRYGLDLQRYINLYAGDRVLFLRAYVEGITGDLDSVSFVDLPQLGGPVFLRGYERDRFRDRIATLATVEYNYVVERNFSAYVFADAGRVWRAYEKVGVHGTRIGFGGGLQMHSVNSFLARALIASSIDGGLFFNLSFDPVYDARSREESR